MPPAAEIGQVAVVSLHSIARILSGVVLIGLPFPCSFRSDHSSSGQGGTAKVSFGKSGLTFQLEKVFVILSRVTAAILAVQETKGLPSQHTMEMMAKAAAAVYETALENYRPQR